MVGFWGHVSPYVVPSDPKTLSHSRTLSATPATTMVRFVGVEVMVVVVVMIAGAPEKVMVQMAMTMLKAMVIVLGGGNRSGGAVVRRGRRPAVLGHQNCLGALTFDSCPNGLYTSGLFSG